MAVAQEKKEPLIHATTWVSLKVIMLSERSQTKKNTYYNDSICIKTLEHAIFRNKKQGLAEHYGVWGQVWRKVLGVMDLFIILIVVMISQV